MRIRLGTDKFEPNTAVVIDTARVVNNHMAIVGGTGAGKTYRIRKLINGFNTGGMIRFHILDVHGDIVVDGASSVKFSETTQAGLNPLSVSSDYDFGGVRKRIRSFISTINRTSRQLGSKQESVLMALMNDLYIANGFYPDKPESWDIKKEIRSNVKYPKKNPTLTDLKRFTENKLKQMLTGAGSKASSKLEELNKKIQAMDRGFKKELKGEEVDIGKAKSECIAAYTEFINSVETGRELDDFIKYDSKDVLKSVYEKIVNLESTGIFKSGSLPFDNSSNVWRYDIKALSRDEQKMFVDMLLEDIFLKAKQAGEQPEVTQYIVIDEAHIFMCEEPDHILNLIAKEARKFGIGLMLASQSFTHFPEDIIASTAVKIVLGIDEMYHDGSARKLKIDAKRFSYIKPQQSCLVQIKTKGDMSNKFFDCIFDKEKVS